MGCSVGIKEKHTLIFSSPVPIPEAAKGVPIIATNEKIHLAILNKPDMTFKRDIGMYVVVDPHFYALLIDAYNAQVEARRKMRGRPP